MVLFASALPIRNFHAASLVLVGSAPVPGCSPAAGLVLVGSALVTGIFHAAGLVLVGSGLAGSRKFSCCLVGFSWISTGMVAGSYHAADLVLVGPTLVTGSSHAAGLVLVGTALVTRRSHATGLVLIGSALVTGSFHAAGAHFTNDFLPAIQILWKLRLVVIPLLAIRSQQIFRHATTAQLSCQVQNFVAITLSDSRCECNEISIEFEMRWKSRK